MTEEQAKALKVGDKVRYVGGYFDTERSNTYVIAGIDSDGDPYVDHEDLGGRYVIFGAYLAEFELAEAKTQPYRIEIVGTSADFDESGMVHISAYVNDELLAHLRDIEAEQGREAKRNKIREQIAKLEAELESLG